MTKQLIYFCSSGVGCSSASWNHAPLIKLLVYSPIQMLSPYNIPTMIFTRFKFRNSYCDIILAINYG